MPPVAFFFAYRGSYLCRLGSGELWYMVGDLRIEEWSMHVRWDALGNSDLIYSTATQTLLTREL